MFISRPCLSGQSVRKNLKASSNVNSILMNLVIKSGFIRTRHGIDEDSARRAAGP